MELSTALMALQGAGGVLSFGQQRAAGDIASEESKVEAAQIETAAAAREADRKSDLARAVASQSAGAGASGITFEGSPLSVLQEDIRREEEATSRDKFQARLGAQAARTRGKVAKSQAKGLAVTSLLKTGANMAMTGLPQKKAK